MIQTREIRPGESYIDSRDVEARIDELRDCCTDKDEAEEFRDLLKLKEEAEGYSPDWLHGATLIHEDDFEDYAREFAEDIGAVDHSQGWPGSCIDWEQAANELRQDYTEIEWCGEAYLVR